MRYSLIKFKLLRRRTIDTKYAANLIGEKRKTNLELCLILKNRTIYYIYVGMRKRSGKNVEYGLKIKDVKGRETPTKIKK